MSSFSIPQLELVRKRMENVRERAASQERAKIVAYLRSATPVLRPTAASSFMLASDLIEKGEHHG